MLRDYLDLEQISDKYPKLIYDETSEILKGKIEICKRCRDEVIKGEYNILIDLKSNILPFAFDKGNAIKKNYPHKYIKDNRLCLATDIEQILFLKEKKKVSLWIEKYIESYFISYEYFTKYGVYPFGEYSHGNLGLKEFYLDYFNIKDEKNSENILDYILLKKYRGHDLCPCGSNIRVRNCHSDLIINCKNDENIEILSEYYRRNFRDE